MEIVDKLETLSDEIVEKLKEKFSEAGIEYRCIESINSYSNTGEKALFDIVVEYDKYKVTKQNRLYDESLTDGGDMEIITEFFIDFIDGHVDIAMSLCSYRCSRFKRWGW